MISCIELLLRFVRTLLLLGSLDLRLYSCLYSLDALLLLCSRLGQLMDLSSDDLRQGSKVLVRFAMCSSQKTEFIELCNSSRTGNKGKLQLGTIDP